MAESNTNPVEQAIEMAARATELLRQASEESVRTATGLLQQVVNELERIMHAPLSQADYARIPVLAEHMARNRELTRHGLKLTSQRNEQLFGRAEFYPGRR